MLGQLATVRSLGHSVTHDELQQGVYGLAVPVLDQTSHAIAGLAVILPASRAAHILDYLGALSRAAEQVSAALQIGSTLTDPPATSS